MGGGYKNQKVIYFDPECQTIGVLFGSQEDRDEFYESTRGNLPKFTTSDGDVVELHWKKPKHPLQDRKEFLLRKTRQFIISENKFDPKSVVVNKNSGNITVSKKIVVYIKVDRDFTHAFTWPMNNNVPISEAVGIASSQIVQDKVEGCLIKK